MTCVDCGKAITGQGNLGKPSQRCFHCAMKENGRRTRVDALHPPCANCGQPVRRARFKYCDRTCYTAAHVVPRGPENHMWREESNNVSTAYYRARRVRQKIRCESCGGFGKRLEIHHQDQNPLNNDEANLAVLCSVCHKRWHRELKAAVA